MKVYFERRENNDWICYDEQNTSGDLFVDPSKIQELVKLFPKEGVWSCAPFDQNGPYSKITLSQTTIVEVKGFGNVQVVQYVDILNGHIDRSFFGDRNGNLTVEFPTRFMLDLPQLPAFEPYVYREDENGEG